MNPEQCVRLTWAASFKVPWIAGYALLSHSRRAYSGHLDMFLSRHADNTAQ